MSDPKFFQPKGPFTAGHLAKEVGAELCGDGDLVLRDVGSLSEAGEDRLSFLDNRKYVVDLAGSRAGAILLLPEFAGQAPKTAVLLVHTEPYKAYARLAQLFYPIAPTGEGHISPQAMIDPTATLGENCIVEAGAVIGANAKLANRVHVSANAVIGPAVEIGGESWIGACASLSNCFVGQRVRILPGVRIGQEGFGFAIDPTGHIRIPQLGRVIIEDDVEIGANSTIDRGAGPDTIIGRGAMIDNLVQIGHNVVVGPGCIIVAQAGIAGSTHLEAGVAIGGQVGVVGHLKIGRGAQIAGQSGVMRDVEPGARMMGYPAVTTRQFFRQLAWLERAAGGNKEKQE